MWVRSVHGVAWSGRQQDAKRRAARAERTDHGADDVGVPALERVDLLVGEPLMAGLVGGLDVQQEEVTVGE